MAQKNYCTNQTYLLFRKDGYQKEENYHKEKVVLYKQQNQKRMKNIQILVENSGIVTPFQSITNMYSCPNQKN